MKNINEPGSSKMVDAEAGPSTSANTSGVGSTKAWPISYNKSSVVVLKQQSITKTVIECSCFV